MPYVFLKKLIEKFNFPVPKNLPSLASLLVGYFSYDIIRYIEKVPDKCLDDLKIPDIRLMRPKTIIIHDNLSKKIYFIVNCFADENINNYEHYYLRQIKNIKFIKDLAFSSINKKISYPRKIKKINIKVKSNISKKRFKEMVVKAKKYIGKGDIFQVVLSQRFESKLTKTPLEIYKKLRVENPSPFMFFFNFDDFQIIGVSLDRDKESWENAINQDKLTEWIHISHVKFWNEQYLIEAFLTNNDEWEIILSLNYLFHSSYDSLKNVALYLTIDREPGSLYIRKK